MTRFGLETIKPKRRREESDAQVKLVEDLQMILPRDVFVFAVPNGGSRHPAEAANLKRQGVRAGVPDLIFIWGGKAFGLEMKAKDGRISDSQKVTFPLMRNAGMRIEVAKSYGEALERIKEMGIPLHTVENRKYEIADVFRDANKRSAA